MIIHMYTEIPLNVRICKTVFVSVLNEARLKKPVYKYDIPIYLYVFHFLCLYTLFHVGGVNIYTKLVPVGTQNRSIAYCKF